MPSAQPHLRNRTTVRTPLAPAWLRLGLRVVDLVAPSLATQMMLRFYFQPDRMPLRAEHRATLARADRFELTVDGVPVVGHQWGAGGRAVWLVHGWGGHLGQMTPFVDALVQKGFRVIGADWPGHGASGGHRSSLRHAQSMLQHLTRFVGAPYGVIAHLFGAAATTLALSQGLTAQRVVYEAPVARLRPYIERFTSAFALTGSMEQRFISSAEAWLNAPFAQFEPLRFTAEMRTPVLILHSSDDRDVPVADGESIASTWPGARIGIQKGLGHRRILNDPACVAAAIDFIAG